MKNLIDRILAALRAAWEHLDPKLKYTVISGVLAYALTKGAIQLDPEIAAAISGAIASVVGYSVENDASVIRKEDELGEDVPLPLPPDVSAANQDPLADVDVAKLK